MPFITEEIWHYLMQRDEEDSIMISSMPEAGRVDNDYLEHFDRIRQVITTIRNIRNEKQIPVKEKLELGYVVNGYGFTTDLSPVIKKLANISEVRKMDKKPEGWISFIVRNVEYFLNIGDKIDVEIEINKLLGELDYTRGFLDSVMKKLNNKRFVQNAPEAVIEKERIKKSDAENKIVALEHQIQILQGQKI